MQGTTTELLLALVLITLSAFFSATETAYSSLNRARLKSLADRGQKRAADTLALAERYDELLSTILVGNNIVNIALASVGTVMFVRWLGGAGVGVSTAVVTVFVLIFGEISPKSLAKESPERFARFSAPAMRALVLLFTPLNFLFSQWKRLLSCVFRADGNRAMTEDELLTIVQEAQQEGGIDAQESELIRSAIGFNDLKAVDIFTPRVDVSALSADASVETATELFTQSGYSRLPVYEGSIDNIIGVVHNKDFFRDVASGSAALRDVTKPAMFVSENIPIAKLLRLLQKHKAHMAVVTDEYGGTIGIVTMEDILEELVGEIWDEHDEVVEPVRRVDENTWRVDGGEGLHRVEELFGLNEDSQASTVAGWTMERLGRIPQEGDSFTQDGLTVTVTRTDERRVLEVEVRRLTPDAAAGA